MKKIINNSDERSFFNNRPPIPTINDRLHEIENIAPLATFFKSFVDPVIVVLVLFSLHLYFETPFTGVYIVLAVISFLMSVIFLDGTRLFLPGEKKPWVQVTRFASGWCIISATILLLGVITEFEIYVYPKHILAWLISTPIALITIHWIVRKIIFPDGRAQSEVVKVLIVGANQAGLFLKESIINNTYLKMNFIGFFDDRDLARLPGVQEDELLGKISELTKFAQENEIDHIYISLPMTSQPRVKMLIDELQDSTVSIYFVPDFFIFDLIQARFDHVAGVPVVCICESPFRGLNAVAKRFSDIVVSLGILSLIWPIMMVVGIAVKLTSDGPILFKQKRYGADGKSINVYKFRSMNVMENGNTIKQAEKNDSRLTPIGGFLRKTSLDELPQLLNVLEGSMSIVGPRPHANAHNEYYRKLIKGYMIRHKVKPGITGWAQVNGFRGETETLDKMENRINYDLDYLRNWSLWMDLKIIIMTVALVIKRKNAY